jgi:hypothetical protein
VLNAVEDNDSRRSVSEFSVGSLDGDFIADYKIFQIGGEFTALGVICVGIRSINFDQQLNYFLGYHISILIVCCMGKSACIF